MSAEIRERIVRFGSENGLAGIHTVSRDSSVQVPHVVIVNAGIIHRVGPNRLYVDLARTAAALGYPVLRFDIAGLGDSDSIRNGLSLTELAQDDIRTAFDFLEQSHGAREFIVMGLCSGANYAVLASFRESRVIGTLLIDPTVTRTRRSAMLHLMRRLLHLPTWGSIVSLSHPLFRRSLGLMRTVAVARAAEGQSGERSAAESGELQLGVIASMLQRSIDRGVRMMLVFTGGVNHVYNYRQQLFDLLPEVDFRDQLRLEYMPETDHTVCDGPSREKLLVFMSEWLRAAFPSSPTPVTAETAGDFPNDELADIDLVIE